MSPEEIEIPYSDSNNHLKFHYSILKGKPIIPDYKVDEKTAIIFNIPE